MLTFFRSFDDEPCLINLSQVRYITRSGNPEYLQLWFSKNDSHSVRAYINDDNIVAVL